jgi:hypothetical protein
MDAAVPDLLIGALRSGMLRARAIALRKTGRTFKSTA